MMVMAVTVTMTTNGNMEPDARRRRAEDRRRVNRDGLNQDGSCLEGHRRRVDHDRMLNYYWLLNEHWLLHNRLRVDHSLDRLLHDHSLNPLMHHHRSGLKIHRRGRVDGLWFERFGQEQTGADSCQHLARRGPFLIPREILGGRGCQQGQDAHRCYCGFHNAYSFLDASTATPVIYSAVRNCLSRAKLAKRNEC